MAKTERFEMRLAEDLQERVDAWRARQPDLPGRSEAIRRLTEMGLQTTSKRSVNFSDGEKAILLALRDMRNGTKEVDLDLIAAAIVGGHTWAPVWDMSLAFTAQPDDPADVTFVVDTLDMWTFIESSIARLDQVDKAQVTAAAPHPGRLAFAGFDGNEESELYGITHFLIHDMGRFGKFKDRELNSHMPTAARYRSMLQVFLPLRATLHGGLLSAEQLIALMASQPRPSRAEPADPTDAEEGMDWWNALSESDRARWLRTSGSARPADAWAAYQAANPTSKSV